MSDCGETEPVGEQSPGDANAPHIHQEAHASGSGSIIQSGRDTHYYLRDGVRHYRQTDGPVVEECPYPGLAAFTSEQARWFFGRARLIAEVTSRIDSSLMEGPLVMVAPSGAGKSSLLQAGLLPALARGALPAVGSQEWPRLVFTPTAHPITEMATRIAALTGAEPASAAAELTADPDRGVTILRAALRSSEDSSSRDAARAVVVVDQLEELFTLCTDEAERRGFIDLLARLAEPPPGGIPAGLVICGLRADFYAPCTDYPQLRAALQNGQILLGPMSESELRETILYPAESVGLDVEPGLVELLLRDIGAADGGASDGSAAGYEAGRLPLLAHALRATWQQRHGSTLTVEAYLATGGIQHAVATTADRVFADLDTSAQETTRWMFLRLVKIGDGAIEDTRRRVSRTDILREAAEPGAARAVLDAFTHARLLTQRQDTVEITHEALLRAWPSLRQWIDSDRAGNLIRQQLEDDAATWDRHGRDTSALYRGSRLATARTWIASSPSGRSMSAAATAFLTASNRQEHRVIRIRRAAVAVLAGLALVASTAALYAFNERATAIAQRTYAVSAEAATVANALYASDPALAKQLSLAAFKLAPSPEAYGSLLNATGKPIPGQLGANVPGFDAEVFNADGSMLATSSSDAVQLWHVSAADPTNPTALPTIHSTRAINSGPQLWFDPGHTQRLAILYGRHASLENAYNPYRFSAGNLTAPHSDLAFSRDGRLLAIGQTDGSVDLWNIADPRNFTSIGRSFRAPGAPSSIEVSRVALSPDGSVLATVSGPTITPGNPESTETVRLWNIADPAKPRLLPATLRSTTSLLAFSPVGHTLATGSADNSVQLWNVTNPSHPTPTGPPLSGHTGTVSEMVFSADGHRMATASWDGSVRLWNVTDPAHPTALAVLGRESSMILFTSVAISPDGQLLAATGIGLLHGSVGVETWLWKIDPLQAAADVCAAGSASSPISQAQWRLYFPGEAYSPPCPGT
jgi:WD domain, G-beta repeat